MPRTKKETKPLTVKELTMVIKSHQRTECPVLPKTKSALQSVSKRLGLPTQKRR